MMEPSGREHESPLSAPRQHFYQARALTEPLEERIPATRGELAAMVDELHARGRPALVVGDGQHLRHDLGGAVALRTERLDQLLNLSRENGLVSAQAGIRWRDLQDAVEAEGLTLSHYALMPSTATLGGLLARFRPGPKTLGQGAIRDGCVALAARGAPGRSYDYLVAPRKASGPDLRYLFIGGEGHHGVITEATLVARRQLDAELLIFEGLPLSEALTLLDAIYRAQIRWQWVYYSAGAKRLQLALGAPGQLLRTQVRWIEAHLRAPDAHLDLDALRARRRWLEDRHPARRTHARARQASAIWCTAAALQTPPLDLSTPDIDELTLTSFAPDRVELVVEHGAPLDVPMPGVIARWPLCQTLPPRSRVPFAPEAADARR
ncbi:hypothetical protein DL240_17595 [Lujinxingia litoralis]|uniref:FAD-binding PCMH-type domain-containing protein n=1 Tax=Lujinxingia litoralis TaxID=2211119 RepID=A0A328C780_9DELT|nr:FAD-binding protein [Lujinxingia litoralis]RAL20394.1 hypothetical protein DL240_17595 [Lujinxingia litoralis]